MDRNRQKERMKNALFQGWPMGVSLSRLLRGDEKYRLELALACSKTNQQAIETLGISERTFFRWLKKYNLKGHGSKS